MGKKKRGNKNRRKIKNQIYVEKETFCPSPFCNDDRTSETASESRLQITGDSATGHEENKEGSGGVDASSIQSLSNENDDSSLLHSPLTSPSGLSSSESTVEIENLSTTAMTATVFIAAPFLKNHSLGITGENAHLGEWTRVYGTFKVVEKINRTTSIYEGSVPVPSVLGSPFKFVHVNSVTREMTFEGKAPSDNRCDELLPGAISFFIYKTNTGDGTDKTSSSFMEKIYDVSKFIFGKSETKQEAVQVAIKFYDIIFQYVMKNLKEDPDAAYDFIEDSLKSVRNLPLNFDVITGSFQIFLNNRLQTRLRNRREKMPAKEFIDFEELLFLLVGVCEMGVIFSKDLKEIIIQRNQDFSIYLNGCRKFNRRSLEFGRLREAIANQVGLHHFGWMLFHSPCYQEELRRFDSNEVLESIAYTFKEIPNVFLTEPEVTSRVMKYLVTRFKRIDDFYACLLPVFHRNANYEPQLNRLLLQKLLNHKTISLDDCTILLQSDFLLKKLEELLMKKTISPSADPEKQFVIDADDFLKELIVKLFDNKQLSDILTLVSHIPHDLLPVFVPVVENAVEKRLTGFSYLNVDYYLSSYHHLFESKLLDNFPKSKQMIRSKFLTTTRKHLKTGSFQSIPSLRLVLLGLSERTDIPFLKRPAIKDLQDAVNRQPRKFFQNLHAAILQKPLSKSSLSTVETILKPFEKGVTKDVVERLLDHFDQIERIITLINSMKISLVELESFQDPQVLDVLKHVGLEKKQEDVITNLIYVLQKRHFVYGAIYTRFCRLNVTTVQVGVNQDDEEDDRDEEVGDDQLEKHEEEDYPLQEDEGETDEGLSDVIQILNPKDWEVYLNDIQLDQSVMTLRGALDLAVPLQFKTAGWLVQVKSCALFFEKVWRPMVESFSKFPLCNNDLEVFVEDCGKEWALLAVRVASGTLTFEEMGEIVALQTDATVLSQRHLVSKPVLRVIAMYRNFQNLNELRHLIGPFLAALEQFHIHERKPIAELDRFVKEHLIQNWDNTTLAQAEAKGVTRLLNDALAIDPARPESQHALKLISSLVTDENETPLIDWLRGKSEEDMKSMGKILQGTLLEAYGQLQTLRTKIAPILRKKFQTYEELLKAARMSEERLSHRSSRVSPINCKWLVSMLPSIEAAIRASIISPSEDAKEKLARLNRVVIEPDNDGFTITIILERNGSLSLDEMKQAFQLLDMAAVDDDREGLDVKELVDRTRKYVSLIIELSRVFTLVFASGCITYSFRESMAIELNDLESMIERMQCQLDEWNRKWKEVEDCRVLSLFSRGYLLQLVDLIGRRMLNDALSVIKCILPHTSLKLKELERLARATIPQVVDSGSWPSTEQVFDTLRQLNSLLEVMFHQQSDPVPIPGFLRSYGRTLESHFIDKAVVILNVPRELLVGSSLAAYVSITHRPVEPSRILFVTAHTDKEEIQRFLTLWCVADHWDFFIMVHVERLSAEGAAAVRRGIDRVLAEHRGKLLLLAQCHHRVQSTKSLGARLGLISDRLLEVHFTTDQLRSCLTGLLPSASHLHFFTSKLPGCGKSQQAMQISLNHDYYRIPVRCGTVEELLASLKRMEIQSNPSKQRAAVLHLDVAYSVSQEFNDILLSFLIHGAVYDPRKARLGLWMISAETYIAIEFASPFGMEEFPIISYLGQHHLCQCDSKSFSYDLNRMPDVAGQPVIVNRSDGLVAAGKFLQLQQEGEDGLNRWDRICASPELMITDPLPKEETYRLLVASFQHEENRNTPTFSALNAMASFLYRHLTAMVTSLWFNESAIYLFDDEHLARVFKRDIFNMLLKVANDSVARCWSLINPGRKLPEMDWTNRQRAMFLLGFSEDGFVAGMNVVGRDSNALRAMFHPSLLAILQQQCLQFQELRGFKNLMESYGGVDVIINAMRSLLLLDGTASSGAKVLLLDNQLQSVPAIQRLQQLTGQERGYVLTGDNITKMMFALYRIRCGLPVIAFGESGVGKTALFRFLISTLLGHTFEVCNVNSGTTIHDVEKMIQLAVTVLDQKENSQVFLFFDEMNTADPPVIGFLKELMLDRHCNGTALPNNLHLMAAANPYRYMHEADKEATVGLAFRFSQTAQGSGVDDSDGRSLVYRVNQLPLAFYDHIYDFGYLCNEAEETYIEEICQQSLANVNLPLENMNWFATITRKSHKIARALSKDPDSAVSLRDATRAVQLYKWFCSSDAGKKIASNWQEAADLSIYLVYAFRFRDRTMFLEHVFGLKQSATASMANVSREIAKRLYGLANEASIGSGVIALNDALCENLFALYVCVLNGIFLIIVGRPGSSKSLSVEILKLVLSPENYELRHELGDLPAVTDVYFQCSPLSTSSGFKALFHSAKKISVDPKQMLALVVLDELGLADMSPEKPMKVLHAELERKSILTSGNEELSPYSVVALSNWVVDAAQVNRGILITRTEASEQDLMKSAQQLTESLVTKYTTKSSTLSRIQLMLKDSLQTIVSTYQKINKRSDIGGGHFFSMRDFFFCVKNFVCFIFDWFGNGRSDEKRDARISSNFLAQSVIRNFGGHDKAQRLVRAILAENLKLNQVAIATMSPLELIVQNIQDSSKKQSIHIARHLMILNRSLIGLQLLNRYVKKELDSDMHWNVLFGSCFPGDLEVTAVTRKLRQVEQSIRTGGVVILCHADQLFESLYMVLNQQYWMQDGVTMTQIALGPSIRPIALPDGPFRIIALQDTDVALNQEMMSPAVLSRFEKHELRPSHLLDESGRIWLNVIKSHPVWLSVLQEIKRQKMIYGYHEELFSSLALHLQDNSRSYDVKDLQHLYEAHAIWMRAINPMEVIKLESYSCGDVELQDFCQLYRRSFIMESIDDALKKNLSNRMILMTNTMRHMDVKPSHPYRSTTIQLFDVQSELELIRLLAIDAVDLDDPEFCLIIQYDAVTGPIEQYQLTKYEVEQRFNASRCRVLFVVHVDPRPVNMNWVFSFGDGWDYVFVDEVVSSCSANPNVQLTDLVSSSTDQTMSIFIDKMSPEAFKSILLEMLGPVLQTSLTSLRSNLGQFYSGIRRALGLPKNHTLIQLIKDCLLAQLNENGVRWRVVDAVNDSDFDSSSSLTEGLWNMFKKILSNPLAQLLIISDVWRVCDQPSAQLWCQFVNANYPDCLMSIHSSDLIIQIPTGFRCCTRPFGRLLASFDKSFVQHPNSSMNRPLNWLLNFIGSNEEIDAQDLKQAYFLDWFVLRVPPHLHHCARGIPLFKMRYLVDSLFEDASSFVMEWEDARTEVIAALELLSIASFTRLQADIDDEILWDDWTGRVRKWKCFSTALCQLSLTILTSPEVLNNCHAKLIQSISSIEASPALVELVDHLADMQHLWLGLRIIKRILIFDSKSPIKFPELHVSTPQRLIDNLADLVIASIIRPRVVCDLANGQTRRQVRQGDLYAILKNISACTTPKELVLILGECPVTHSIVLLEDKTTMGKVIDRCSSCNQFLNSSKGNEEFGEEPMRLERKTRHLRVPDEDIVESLLQDHHKFMFLFESVAEIFIQQHRNNPPEIDAFLKNILSADSRLRVSWRFLTVIIRSTLSTRAGIVIIDSLLQSFNFNRLTKSDNHNVFNLMQALLASADHDVSNEIHDRRNLDGRDFNDAACAGDWTIKRVRRLAAIRHHLANSSLDSSVNSIANWRIWADNQQNDSVTESLLFFILRFSTDEGDQTRLGALFRNQQVVDILGRHSIIKPYMKNLSPLSLGFDMISADVRAIPFENRLLDELPMDQEYCQHYPLLLQLQPEWAPFIARLAYHAADVFDTKNIRLLRHMATSLTFASNCFLPGIDDHPYLTSYTAETFRWFVCDCKVLNCVGNCGNPTNESVCLGCRRPLSLAHHTARAGVRRATIGDFAPPVGLHLTRKPSLSPTYAVRNLSPSVTRLALLLNSLALMNAALDLQTDQRSIDGLLLTLPIDERQPNPNRTSLIGLLSNHVITHLDLFCQLLATSRSRQLAMTDKFRIGHLILHQLLNYEYESLAIRETEFSTGTHAREMFERGLTNFLAQSIDYRRELDNLAGQSDQATKDFYRSLHDNETDYWPYTRLVFSNRQSVQLELARNHRLRQKFPFLNFLLDEDNWMTKLDALQYLGEAIRFIALVRTVLQGCITRDEANHLTIRHGLDQIVATVSQQAVLLDRGRTVSCFEDVACLFNGFKQLWDCFSQLQNTENRTFLDYFECRDIDLNFRPERILQQSAPLILILAGSDLPETTFSYQLLVHAVETASSISLTSFIHPHCRAGSGRVRLSSSSAAALCDLDESLYAHVPTTEIDSFIRDHVIDGSTLRLAESFAMAAILGSTGSTIAEDLCLDVIPEFIFKEDFNSNNYIVNLERRSLVWQPTPIPPRTQELILTDLESHRGLAEAKALLISAITHLQTSSEPLIASQVRNKHISDVLKELEESQILTERHMSAETLSVFNRHMKLEVRHSFGLLKAIVLRMKGEDVFGGRIPIGWGTMMPPNLAQLTNKKLRACTRGNGIVETLLMLTNIVSDSQNLPEELRPHSPMLFAIQQIEGVEWDGLPTEVKMENLGHVLLIAEGIKMK